LHEAKQAFSKAPHRSIAVLREFRGPLSPRAQLRSRLYALLFSVRFDFVADERATDAVAVPAISWPSSATRSDAAPAGLSRVEPLWSTPRCSIYGQIRTECRPRSPYRTEGRPATDRPTLSQDHWGCIVGSLTRAKFCAAIGEWAFSPESGGI
jgi:hypothetical protein